MKFHGIVLLVNAVLAGRVKVELGQTVCCVASNESAVGGDFKSGAEILKLGTLGVAVDLEGNGAVRGAGVDGRVDVDRRLVLALGAHLVRSLVERVPIQRTVESSVSKLADGNTGLTREVRSPVVIGRHDAAGQDEGRGNESDLNHFESI